jgi:hypothetical protein
MQLDAALALLLTLGFAVVVIWGVARSSRVEREADWFRYQYEVRVTGPGYDLIKRYLRRTRAWRAGGVAIGLTVAVVAGWILHERINVFAGLFVGWFIAGLLAELPTRQPAERRRATLTPRAVDQFLPRFPRRVLVAATSSTVVALVGATCVHQLARLRRHDENVGIGVPTAALLLSLALATVSVAGMRRLAYKPFPVTEPEINVAEAAIRTAASVRIAAGWAALQFIITMWICASVASVADPRWAMLANTLALLSFFGILIAWTFVPTRVLRGPHPTVTTP